MSYGHSQLTVQDCCCCYSCMKTRQLSQSQLSWPSCYRTRLTAAGVLGHCEFLGIMSSHWSQCLDWTAFHLTSTLQSSNLVKQQSINYLFSYSLNSKQMQYQLQSTKVPPKIFTTVVSLGSETTDWV